jgi:hypothetical protein
MTRRVGCALTAATVLAQICLVACALDFDRFDPIDASSDTSTAQMPAPGAGPDASRPDATQMSPDRGDAGTPVPRDASCTPPANCFTQAQSCGTQCSDQHKQCLSNCGGGNCMRHCDTSEQNCLSQCETQCAFCTLPSGCSARNNCLDAVGGG